MGSKEKNLENLFKNVSVDELLTNAQFVELFTEQLHASSSEELSSLSKTAAKEAYAVLIATLGQALSAGRKVRIKDLGTFSTRYRPSRVFRTPHDPNAKVETPETVGVHFSIATGLKQRVQNNTALVTAHAKLANKAAKKK
ncbi:HU family DNA-binding protein [Psittacicella gerlachiana]|uniref:DNA-binding protein n=1 Tax=Psittacicella gerlachiana TaxID=2028574 RepID=A0A3A1Y1G5_9GAMM|nr:HU family DNA-binding protein [Psittacicella gerlachiana]RIY31301.1 hypothetical protein CKF59_07735 [Psittacicella gerlachiana]